MRGLSVCALLTLGPVACVPDSPRTRDDVATSLRERVGFGLRAPDTPRQPAVPSTVELGDGLSAGDAVAIALWNNGRFQATLAQLGFARAELTRAGVLPNPVFSTFLPLGPKQLEFSLGWNLAWLWQRGARVEVASLRMEQIAETLVQAGLDVARDARVAHARAVAAEERTAIAQQAADTWLEIVRLMEVRLAVGMASELELSTVTVDARTAQIDAERQARNADLARVELRRVLGLEPETDLATLTPPELPAQLPERSHLLKTAMAARPDLRAAELTLEAETARVGLEARSAYQITAVLDANGEGREGFEMGPGFNLPIPLFDRNQAGQEDAEAAVEQAAWNYLAVRQTIAAEVDSAALRLRQAHAALLRWPDEVLTPAERNVTLAKKAFAAGGTSYLAVLESTRGLLNAQQRHIDLMEAARCAAAELARSVGKDLSAQRDPNGRSPETPRAPTSPEPNPGSTPRGPDGAAPAPEAVLEREQTG